MAYRNLVINTAATALIGALAEQPNVRIRATDGGLQIRPTDRTSPVNLPKGEILRPLGRKTPTTAKIGLTTDTLPEIAGGTRFAVEAAKYGWFSLQAIQDLPRGAPGASVSAK
jgi:hypothetical protein